MTREERRYMKLFDSHVDFIEETYGKDVSANIGWSQSEDCVTSKIYLAPREYVSSWYDEDGQIEHEVTGTD